MTSLGRGWGEGGGGVWRRFEWTETKRRENGRNTAEERGLRRIFACDDGWPVDRGNVGGPRFPLGGWPCKNRLRPPFGASGALNRKLIDWFVGLLKRVAHIENAQKKKKLNVFASFCWPWKGRAFDRLVTIGRRFCLADEQAPKSDAGRRPPKVRRGPRMQMPTHAMNEKPAFGFPSLFLCDPIGEKDSPRLPLFPAGRASSAAVRSAQSQAEPKQD